MRKTMKRTCALLLAMLMLFTAAPLQGSAATVAGLLAGDVDRDGSVTAADARLALRTAVGLEKTDADMIRCADADRDYTAADPAGRCGTGNAEAHHRGDEVYRAYRRRP